MDTAHTERARTLSSALKTFHRALIKAEAGNDPTLESPYSKLFALIGDPRFAWMSPLSGLIVRIDEAVDEDEAREAGAISAFIDEASGLIAHGRGESDATFRLRHLMALQAEPDVGLATGQLRSALKAVAA